MLLVIWWCAVVMARTIPPCQKHMAGRLLYSAASWIRHRVHHKEKHPSHFSMLEITRPQCIVAQTAVGSKVLLFGGRLGPHQPTNSLAVLETSERKEQSGCSSRLEEVDTVSGPAARWRHSATHVRIGSRDVLVVLGGRGTDANTFSLDEGWLLDCDELSWKCCPIFPTDGSLPCARHSHAATDIAPQGLLMICGGLDANEELLGDAWILQRDDDRDCFTWRRTASPLPRPRSTVAKQSSTTEHFMWDHEVFGCLNFLLRLYACNACRHGMSGAQGCQLCFCRCKRHLPTSDSGLPFRGSWV